LPSCCCMAMSLYVGVTRLLIHGKSVGWLAQSKRAGTWQAGFKTQAAAAKWLAKKLQVKPSGLRRSRLARNRGARPEECGVSYYRGVIPKGRGADGQCHWEARARGRSLGTFRHQAAAAQAVARTSRTSVQSLRKTMSAKRARQIFKAAYQVFKGYVPGDLQHTRQQERQYQRWFKQEIGCVSKTLLALGTRALGSCPQGAGGCGGVAVYTLGPSRERVWRRGEPVAWFSVVCRLYMIQCTSFM